MKLPRRLLLVFVLTVQAAAGQTGPEDEFLAPRSALERAQMGGPLTALAFYFFVLAIAVLFVWLVYLAFARSRASPAVGGLAMCTALVAYFIFDWKHIALNLAMRRPQEVRRDCQRLLDRVGPSRREFIHQAAFPSSFHELGARGALVDSGVLYIYLEIDHNGGGWGFAYVPNHKDESRDRRSTWYADFMESSISSE